MLASASSLLVRYLHSGKEVREQIRWLAFAASVVVLGYFVMVIMRNCFFASDTAGGCRPPVGKTFSQDAITISFAGIPVAIGFAVLKYRLYDIEIIINRDPGLRSAYRHAPRALLRGHSGIAAALRLAHGPERSTLAVVASTLVIAALFNPLRRRIQAFIDRRFYRRKYDARKTLEAFSVKLREETDLEALNDELVGVVRETMQPAHVSLWLRPETAPKRERA